MPREKGFYDDGQIAFDRDHLDDEPHGDQKYWYRNGQHCKTACLKRPQLESHDIWDHGKLVSSKAWHPNGQLRFQTSYKDGDKHGAEQGWHDNGVKQYHKFFIRGKLQGLSRRWSNTGSLIWCEYYMKGKYIGDYKPVAENIRTTIVNTYDQPKGPLASLRKIPGFEPELIGLICKMVI